jgi:hypothetical protein
MEYSNLPATFLYCPVSDSRNRGSYTSKLWDAIFHTLALTKILLEHHGELGDLHVKPLLRCIGLEIEALISHRFGPFNPEQTVADLKLNTAIQDLQSQAPML